MVHLIYRLNSQQQQKQQVLTVEIGQSEIRIEDIKRSVAVILR